MDRIRLQRGKTIILLIAITLCVLLSFKFIFPLLIPFIIAFVLAMFLNPMVVYLNSRLKINKSILSTIIITFIIIGILLAVYYGSKFAYEQGLQLWEDLRPIFTDTFSSFDLLPKIENFIYQQFLPGLLKNTIKGTKSAVEIIGQIFIIVISTFIFIKDFTRLKCFIIDSYYGNKIFNLVRNLKSALANYVKAQSVIMVVIAIVASIVFLLLDVAHPFVFGFLLGALDTLPLIGSGLFLIPASIYLIIIGNYFQGVVYFSLYIICSIIRELLEPRLLGKTLNIHPIIVLISVYSGIKIFGTAGFLYGPLSYIVILELYKEFKDEI